MRGSDLNALACYDVKHGETVVRNCLVCFVKNGKAEEAAE